MAFHIGFGHRSCLISLSMFLKMRFERGCSFSGLLKPGVEHLKSSMRVLGAKYLVLHLPPPRVSLSRKLAWKQRRDSTPGVLVQAASLHQWRVQGCPVLLCRAKWGRGMARLADWPEVGWVKRQMSAERQAELLVNCIPLASRTHRFQRGPAEAMGRAACSGIDHEFLQFL